MSAIDETYPASIMIDYPATANRLSTFLRIFYVIPILIILWLLNGGGGYVGGTAGILFGATLLMILFRKKYPRWWFDWNLNLTRFSLRVTSYMLLLRHEYPSTDEEQAVHVELRYPDAQRELSRGLPLVKWFLAIPHFVILYFLYIAVFFLSIVAWFAIMFTGRYPESFFGFVVGVVRWTLRVNAYAFLLITDKYPPFSLK